MTRFATTPTLAQPPVLLALCVITAMVLVGCREGDTDTPDEAATSETLDVPGAAGATDAADSADTADVPSAQETPVEAIASIIALYRARDFDALFRTRYAEINKAENEEQIQILIDRHASRFESDEALNGAIATYTSVLELTPELTEDGTVATFQLDGGFIKLSKMANGTWGFHL